ncbi:MAG: hypothetical protein PHY02_10625 [Phycisphaerae bacterium]|nr:hypothetical protein [Phycisphaerae bacterium]
MKDSKEYSKKMVSLYRSLKRKCSVVPKVTYDEPVDALVYAIISDRLSEESAQSAIKRFTEHFVNWNDLRVSRMEEIAEVLGPDVPVAREIAAVLITALRSVFNKYNMVSLKALCKMSKRPARVALEKIESISRFVVDYCMLTSLRGHAIPLTKTMIEYLKNSELVHPEADEQEIEGFLSRQVSAGNAYGFYFLLRQESETCGASVRKKAVRKTKKKAKK